MAISCSQVQKSFGVPATHVLKGIEMQIDDGDYVAITGKSGSGKSTLMYILSTLDQPTSGKVMIDQQDVAGMNQKDLAYFRNQYVGFVFQFHYLLSELTTLENVLLPAKKFDQQNKKLEYAKYLLNEFGLSDKLDRSPGRLSGGEQQRVAIARSLVMEPKYLFADEPTGNLDTANGDVVMNIFRKFNLEKKMSIIMVTHDPDFAKLANREVFLTDGKIDHALSKNHRSLS